MNTSEIQDELNKYGELITGITVDRGDGSEYFEILDVKRNAVNNVELLLGNEDYIDAQWLGTCDTVRFHLKGSVTIKEDVKYILDFKESELLNIIYTLLDVYDRLEETKATSDKSIVANANMLSEKVWNLKKRFNSVIKGE